jgi:hypothetical protein
MEQAPSHQRQIIKFEFIPIFVFDFRFCVRANKKRTLCFAYYFICYSNNQLTCKESSLGRAVLARRCSRSRGEMSLPLRQLVSISLQ